MDKKINQKDNKNLHNKKNNNNIQKIPLKNSDKNIRPSSKGKAETKNPSKNFKKSNTSKKIPIKNLNECINLPKESKESNEKKIPKKIIKKEIHKKDSQNNTKTTNQPISSDLNIMDQITNLTSLYNALTFINNEIDSTFSSQRKGAERSLYNKYMEAIELKEKNFKLYQQINSMENIIDIDDYFLNNYSKMMSVYPKISNVVENVNDIVSNINYGIDRIYLVDDLLCDENILQDNLKQIKNDFEIMNKNIEKKIEEINDSKDKYNELYNRLNSTDNEINKSENKLNSFKQNVLTSNIEAIHKMLVDKNHKLLEEILNE
jgi:DNA repair ATPase RecN